MKYPKVLKVFGTAIILSLLAVAIPVTPVHAAGEVVLSPTDGTIDDRITITGTGFNKSTDTTDKYAAIYFSSDEAGTLDDLNDEVIHYKQVKELVWLDEDGEFETTFRVPDVLDDGTKDEDVESGAYYVYVCHYYGTTIAPRIRAVATFIVTMGEISLYPSKGKVGTQLEIDGIDFVGNKSITFKYDGNVVPIATGDKQTSSQGEFTSVIRVPDSTAGSHTVSATVSGDEATTTFNVEPEAVISPASGETGATVIISGTGFGKLKAVTIWFHNTAATTVTTNTLGSFYTNFTVPGLQAGFYNIDAEQGANVAKAKFTITVPLPLPAPEPPPPEPAASTSISTATGNVGQGIVMSGAGFKANTTVTIKYDNELLNAVTTDSNGIFAGAFTVPAGKHGNHSIIASDGTNTSELSFAVESTPPLAPSLLSPATGTKVASPLIFNWQAVTDDSLPVTYIIQIATSPDFSAASTVLEKTGLTKPGYSLTEQEDLRLDVSERPYYWRVMAMDGAMNEGNWANTGIFFVVSSGVPVWAIIIIAILAVIFLLAFGYFLRMKTGILK
ncbi:IPT/TIG domain-containing protein [Chloroflexota bacterium]